MSEKSPLMSPSSSSSSVSEGFSPFVAMCFTVNYIMGTGFLTLPWAFNSAGLLLSILTLGVVCFIADISKNYVLETMARADAMFKLKAPRDRVPSRHSAVDLIKEDVEKQQKEQPAGNQSQSYGSNRSPVEPLLSPDLAVVSDRKFEIIELTNIYLGSRGSSLYMCTLGLYMYGTLWAYTSVFANACSQALPLAEALGLGHDDYLAYAALFAIVVVPLTCLELKEQVSVQVVLSMCRFLMVILITGACAAAMNATTPQFDMQTAAKGSSFVDFTGLYKMLPIAVYANIFHHSIPGLSKPVGDKKRLGEIFGWTFAFGMVAYGLIGGVVAWYFGDGIDQSANLNFVSYHGGTGHLNDEGNWEGKAWWVNIVAYFVVIFPATDVVSAFPLNGITLGNSLMGSWYGSQIRQFEGDRLRTIVFRLLGAVPPIIGACFVRDLGTITDYTGITGFAIAFTFPALLHLKSRRAAKRAGLSGKTHYTNPALSSDIAAFTVAGFGIFLICFVFGSLLYEATK